MTSRRGDPATDRRLFVAACVLPIVLLLIVSIAPLAGGSETLYLRDVLNTHFEMKHAYAEALRAGSIPLIDPYRAGGQPLLGNPNSVSLYPDNVLYLIAPVIWSINAHFWLHLLLAPFLFFWMARAWGLSREGAWVAGVCYATGGYFLSNFVFYNLIGAVTLAPALIAACLEFCGVRSLRRAGPLVAILWALLILAGDPFLALLAFLLAIGAVLVRHGAHRRRLLWLSLAFGCGTLIAAPQIVAFLQILGTSFRGQFGYSVESRTLASWDPRQIFEWLLPFTFGRPDRIGPEGFWGHRFFTDRPPYYLSVYPGLLTVALATAALRGGGPARRWAIGAVVLGLFFALGRFNPAGAWLFEVSGGLLRYPIRLWLAVAVGGALLAGLGFEGALLRRERRQARALAAAFVTLAAILAIVGGVSMIAQGAVENGIHSVMPAGWGMEAARAERARWVVLAIASIGVVALLSGITRLASRRPLTATAVLLIVHCGVQLIFLAPLTARDDVRAYVTPPPVIESIPRGSVIVQGEAIGLRGSSAGGRRYPDRSAFWPGRRAMVELHPPAGPIRGIRHALSVSSDGVDALLSHAAQDAAKLSDDEELLRLLAAWGVEYLLLDRALTGRAEALVEPPLLYEGFGGALHVYRVREPAPPVVFAGEILRAPHLNAAVAALRSPEFDPRRMTVLPGAGPPERGEGGEARIVARDTESLVAEVSARSPGVLVVQRSHLPLYRATVDGEDAPILIANLHRQGVRVPAGEHRVEIRIDRRPLTRSLWLMVAGFAALVPLARRRLLLR